MNRWLQQIFVEPLRSGAQFVRDTPQLWSTALVASIIFASFLFLADRFIRIAQDAHERLSDVRVTAMQDTLALVANEFALSLPEYERILERLRETNETFTDLRIVQRNEEGVWVSVTGGTAEQSLDRYAFLFELAHSTPDRTFVYRESLAGARGATGMRALPAELPTVLMAHQTLLAADQQIASSVRDAVILLFVILSFLLFLFFRHAQIVDYSTLYRKLKEVDQLKDDFIAMASHELRSPLSAIRGYLEMIRADSHMTGETHEIVARTERAAEALAALIDEMLDVSRIEQDRLQFEQTRVDLTPVIAEVVELLADKAAAKGLGISQRIADPTLEIVVDPAHLRRVLVNLLDNAIKYTYEGEVSIEAVSEGGRVAIRVSDSGVGMSAEEQKELFKKFYRANDVAVRQQTGSGLGLWITKELVEHMNGTVAVESIKGVGTHVVVTFPQVSSDTISDADPADS